MHLLLSDFQLAIKISEICFTWHSFLAEDEKEKKRKQKVAFAYALQDAVSE